MAGDSEAARKVFATNRQARHDYHLVEFLEAGMVLTGPEVKSIRDGKVVLKDAFASVRNGEVFLHKVHITPYSHARVAEQDPERSRKLLLHRREILKLDRLSRLEGHTLIPTRLYLKDGIVKCELAVAKGKKERDKRASAREEQAKRDMRDALARRAKGR